MIETYNSLINNISTKDLNLLQKKDFIKKVERLDQEGRELFFFLIHCYSEQHSTKKKKKKYVCPYNGQQSKNSLAYNLLDFPNELKQLLYRFISMHIQKMEEENDRRPN
jgi:hypothetical protein